MTTPYNFDEIMNNLTQMFGFIGKPLSEDELKVKDELKYECTRFSEVAKRYLPICQEMYTQRSSQVARKEMASGGELIPRGYYCPSPVFDIVVGCTGGRGRLLKRITSRCNPKYEYCYDTNEKMILVNYLHNDCVEILEHNNECVIGILFSKADSEITQIIECKYDEHNRIISYTVARSSFNDCNINEIDKETYTYNDDGLNIAELWNYFNDSLSHDVFKFYHDSDGYLTSYNHKSSCLPDDLYEITIKRKV